MEQCCCLTMQCTYIWVYAMNTLLFNFFYIRMLIIVDYDGRVWSSNAYAHSRDSVFQGNNLHVSLLTLFSSPCTTCKEQCGITFIEFHEK